jgi:poly-gamma-glutamate capsule biosynthesis protein CapA/YwtB (metallophosphatase superfamily)
MLIAGKLRVIRIKIIFTFLVGFIVNSVTAQVSFCAVGDVLFDRGVRNTISNNSVFYLFENVKEIISEKDLAFCNLECPLANIEDGFPLLKKHSFRADTTSVNGLNYAGFNIASVANNHTIDYGKDAFMKTLELLKSHRIFPVGGGKDQSEASEPLLLVKNGETFAFFGMVDFILDATIFDPNSPYPAFIKVDSLCAKIRELNTVVDNIIVSIHWGKGNSNIITKRQTEIAHQLIDAGADLILGHHPHVLQGIETYHNKIIIYSLGNFVFDHQQELNRQSVIFTCKFEKGNIVEPVFIPVSIVNYRPEPSDSLTFKKIFNSLETNSKSLNTNLFIQNKEIKIENIPKKPLKEFFCKDLKFDVYQKYIEMSDFKDYNLQYKLPDTNFIIQDICMLEKSDTAFLYTIVNNHITNKSQIAIFPFSITKRTFFQPSLDKHDYFNPWKIELLDVEMDGNPEIILGVNKSTRYDKNNENRIFVFNRDKDYIYPKWLGSKLAYPFIDFKTDKNGSLILLEKIADSEKGMITLYKWNGFGFNREKVIGEISIIENFKSFNQISGYVFTEL